MEETAQLYDVCIVCALPEEARAFLEVVQRQCDNPPEEGISPRYHYSYRFATIKNDKDEPLNLHISWLPRYGPQEMTPHLSRVLEECQPRITMMTGICAGDAEQVQLGDLVVAERTFTYDNGKFTLDEDGRRVHLHDTMTYQLDANLLQFLGVFDKWRPLVARLKRPPSPPELRKRRKIVCHIKPMASGSAVRADYPFEDVQTPVRGTVAIDMEGAAFGLVMSRHPLIRWLVVKGVSDYANRDKSDVYHDYAARASALYALSFIQSYVTDERLPRLDGPPPRGQTGLPGIWNVPYARNRFFTGREELLDLLHERLTKDWSSAAPVANIVALTQPQAVKGLGGIGKTQIAVEYAYRHRNLYPFTLWVNAATEETLISSFVSIAGLLPSFPEKNELDHKKVVEAVKRWLELRDERWLLIFDNADDITLVRDYLPKHGKGFVVLTTRAQAVSSIAASIEVEQMGWVEGTQLLLRRANRFEQASDEDVNEAGNIVIALDHYPLALDQAGAYIEETGCSLTHYLQLYQAHRKDLLARRGMKATDYPDSVATTWSLSFQKVEQASPAAAELLRLCSFLAPDAIPEELISNGASHWPSPLQQASADPFSLDKAIAELLKFSLVKRYEKTKTLSIHRLVQAVLIDTMERGTQREWAERVLLAVNEIFPNAHDVAMWPQCLRYLSQVQVCYSLIEQYLLMLVEAASLLNWAFVYLWHHALYTIAEPLIRRALLIREQQLGPNHPDTAQTLNNLAGLYRDQGKYEEAEPLYQRALRVWEQALGPDHLQVAYPFNNLALLYTDQGKYAEAEPLLERALLIREQQLGLDHPDTAQTLNNLALLYENQGKYEEAEPLLERALSIYEQQLGLEHPNTAQTLSNLAGLYENQGKYEEAEPLLERALSICERQLGPEHPNTARSLNNLAGLYKSRGKYARAALLLERALSIDEQTFGVDHPQVATDLLNLAGIYADQDKYTQAESLYRRALSIYEQRLGPEHPDTAQTLNNLAALYESQGRYSEAEPLYQRALSIREQQLGLEHSDTVSSLNNLALLYAEQGRCTEAEPLYQRALSICEQQLGPGHPYTQLVRENYASLLRTMRKGRRSARKA